ncbi:MAG: site-2 protease family protein [Rickettsiaceae bacterium]|nr:site-2 protease family protein [Rickettsiaceae bacterium]
MFTLIGFLIVLGVIVFVHEYGHYFAAISLGVKVEEFSIGFGKQIFGRKDSRGTWWRVRIFPLGGFVKMYGDKDAYSRADEDAIAVMSKQEREKSFACKSAISRAVIIAAGPIANYILAIIIFTGLYLSAGKIVKQPAFVGEVFKNSPAYNAGIEKGDEIIRAMSFEVQDFFQLRSIIASHTSESIEMDVRRGSKILHFSIKPEISEDGRMIIGVRPDESKIERSKLGLVASFGAACADVYNITFNMVEGVARMVTSVSGAKQVGGVIAIAKESGRAMQHGSVLLFIAFMSVNIGFMNLLPIPVLDGGRLVLIALERLCSKSSYKKLERWLYIAGVVMVIFLIVISTLNDIKGLFL